MKLKDKVCVVTGGAMGIGEGIVNVFIKNGAKVIILDYNEEVMNKTIQRHQNNGATIEGYTVDVRDNEMVKSIINKIGEKYGEINVLVNNAGTVRLVPFLETTIEDRDIQFDINMKGVWQVTHASVPFMKEGSAIVNLSSVTGPIVSDPGMATYALTKAAIQGFTKGLAADLINKKIRANAIMPGYIRTPLVDVVAVESAPEDPESVVKGIAAGIPMGRLGHIDEVGELAAFLASDESSYITGQSIVIDGGSTMPETGGSVGVE